MSQKSKDELPVTPAGKQADDGLDEAILESFPASDPESSWSGLAEPDPIERPDDASGDAPA